MTFETIDSLQALARVSLLRHVRQCQRKVQDNIKYEITKNKSKIFWSVKQATIGKNRLDENPTKQFKKKYASERLKVTKRQSLKDHIVLLVVALLRTER